MKLSFLRIAPAHVVVRFLCGLCLSLCIPGLALAITSADLLSDAQAFRFSQQMDQDVAVFKWDIADGYHLYQKRFRFVPRSQGLELGPVIFPKGLMEHDESMGNMEVYRGHQEIRVPILKTGAEPIQIEVTAQGCADAGVCYPPHKQMVTLNRPSDPVHVAAADTGAVQDLFKALGIRQGSAQKDLLPPDEAFRFHAEIRDPDTVWVSWRIAEGYYLYREKFGFAIPVESTVKLGTYDIPHGKPREDHEYGAVEVFYSEVGFTLKLERADGEAGQLVLQASYQGCAERGVCYPPMHKTVTLDLPARNAVKKPAGSTSASTSVAGECEVGSPAGFVETEGLSEQCAIVDGLKKDSIWLTALSFLGMGVLLAFTPCIFPMIPILSGIIVGHGHKITTGRALMLSLSYVFASALAYTVFGVLAGLFGSNLQALFQNPKIIMAFSGVFVILALSMFDVFSLQLPGFLQARVAAISNKQHGGTLAGAAIMGALSALIVGPCVAAPLAGALIYIGQTGDALLGGLALFSLGMGMGLPLLAIGASAGKLLPRAGLWMNAVKAVFGVGLLGIAVWLMDRILPSSVTLLLWALLLIVPAIYMGALDSLPQTASGWSRLWKGLGIAMLAYGVLLLIGVASNSTDPLQPLRGVRTAATGNSVQSAVVEGLAFRPVSSVLELNKALADASAQGQTVMLDFYADWCVSCKEMERYTFKDERVRAALAGVVLLKADVTDNSEKSKELLKYFNLVGPPATLFFGPDGNENRSLRVVGYMEVDDFLAHVAKVLH